MRIVPQINMWKTDARNVSVRVNEINTLQVLQA